MHLGSEFVDAREDAGEGAVHALDGVGEVEKHAATLFGELLDVVPRGGVVGNIQRTGEAVETVADGDVEGFAEDAVALGCVRDHLGVAAGDVQHDGVGGACDGAAHLDVADAVVHADQGFGPQERERAGGEGDGLERRAHARALGVADAVDVGELGARVAEGAADHVGDVRSVVECRVLGEEARAGWRDVGVSDVGEDLGGTGFGV